MRAEKSTGESRTIELRLQHAGIYPLLDQLLDFFSGKRHCLWRDLIVKNGSINELKKYYIAYHGLTARQFNSLAKEVSGIEKAQIELMDANRQDLEARVIRLRQKIGSLLGDQMSLKKSLREIEVYREKCRIWKLGGSSAKLPARKPKMPVKIRGLDRVQIKKRLTSKRELLHQKKRRLAHLELKLQKISLNPGLSLCFGTKAHFRKQFNLDAAGLESHAKWKDIFDLKRSSQVFFLGSSDESAGNQSFQYCPIKRTLRIRLPNHKTFSSHGSFLDLPDIEFPEYLREEFYSSLQRPQNPRNKSQKTAGPLSYRIVRRFDPISLKKSYYIQASFSIEASEVLSSRENGAIGLDINADHLAFTEVDRYGNFVAADLIPFDFRGKSSDEAEAIIGDMVAVITGRCGERQKPLVIEDLDFSDKKASLRELGKPLRGMLSSFAYGAFQKAFSSRCRKDGIEFISINPAYTSLIGAHKYQGLCLSSHKKAALAIARRGLCFSESPKVYQLTFSAQVMMQKKIPTDSKHVWKFYSDNRIEIRKLIRRENRPLLASQSILSSGSRHRSLMRSLQCERGSIDWDLPRRRSA